MTKTAKTRERYLSSKLKLRWDSGSGGVGGGTPLKGFLPPAPGPLTLRRFFEKEKAAKPKL